ncbi:hypothetical protein Vafri_11305 [Volvox africanus]|nr:hypothetical protein Vafri_11305 [Volvox africanus]
MSGRPQPALELLTVSARSPEEPPMTVQERTTKGARSPNEQDPHVSGDCSLPLPQLETCRQVKAVLWLDPEDQVLADAEDVYDSDDDISDSSSLAGGQLCVSGGHRGDIGPYSCGGSGGSGSGTGSSLRMADTTCGSAPEAPPPGMAHLSSVGTDSLQPSSALRGATSLVVNSAVVSYGSPYPGDSSSKPSNQTRNCPVTAEAGQARKHAGIGVSGSSIAADCGGGGGSSSSAYGLSRVAPDGHAGTDAGCCAIVLKQCESDQDQLPPKRRCLEGGTAAPPSNIPSPALHDGGGTKYRCACRKTPPSAREELLKKQLSAFPRSELERPVGQGRATGSHDRHGDGMAVAYRTSTTGAVQSGSQPCIGPRLWPEQGRPQPQLQSPPTRYADGGPVQVSFEQADHLARQPFSRGYIDPIRSTYNDFTAASYQVAAARSWTSRHPYVTSSLEHAVAHPAQFRIPQPNLSSRVCGGGGTATAPALAPVAKVQQMPPSCLCPSCSPHSSMSTGTGCGSHLTATSCGTAVIPSAACPDTLGTLSRQEPAPSWPSRHRLKDSTARVGAPATAPVSSIPVALALPHARATSPSTSTGPNDHWSGASPESPQSPACHCNLCAIKPRPLLHQRPPASYTPCHGVQGSQPFIDPNRSYGSAGTHTMPCPSPCLPDLHAPEQLTGPVGQLSHYVQPHSRQMAHQPPRLFRIAAAPGGPLHACQSPLECAPCGQKWINSVNGTPGRGHGHSHQLHNLPCSIKRELSLPEMPSVTSDGGADGGWKPSPHLGWEERSPSSGGAAVPQRQSSEVSSVGGAAVSRMLLHEPGPSCSSEATMGRGSAEVPSEAQRHQKQPLQGAEPAAEQQQQKKGRISSGSSANSDPAPESASAPDLAAAAVGERARMLPVPLQEAEREPPEAPAAAPSKVRGAASNEPQPPQQLQQQQFLQHQRQSQRQDQLQRQPSLQSPQVRLHTNSSERPCTGSERQPYPWHVAQDHVGVSMERVPPQQRRCAHAGSGGAAHNALQAAAVLSRRARSDRTAVALATTNPPPQRDSPHHYVRRCLLPCSTPLPSAVPASGPGLPPPAADSGRSSRVPAAFEPTAAASVLVIRGSTAAQMTTAPFTCRCPHCRSSADPVIQSPSVWQTVAPHPDVMKVPQNAAHYTIRSPQHAGAATVTADRTHWSGAVLANK